MNTPNAREHNIYRYYVVLMLLYVLLAGCNKEHERPIPAPIEDKIEDKRDVLLKQVIAEKLPSPYFQFEYSEGGYADHIGYASHFFYYKVNYKNKRVINLLNEPDGSTLVYEYTGPYVSAIVEYTAANKKIRRHKLSYYSNGLLSEVNSWMFPENNIDSVKEKKIQLQYHADGNLFKKTSWVVNAATLQLEFFTTVEYNNYDSGVNVDDFYLLQDSWAHLLYLPQVRLQKSNPTLVTIKGGINDYQIDYTYTYNEIKLPTTKHLRMEQTRGQNAGTVVKFIHSFTY